MKTTTFTALAAMSLMALGFGLSTTNPASAADPAAMRDSVIHVSASDVTSRFVPLGIGKSVVIDLPRDIKDVLVADPKIANAVVRSSRRAYIIGAAVGQTNVFFFDANGEQITGLDIAVKRDLNGLRAVLKQTVGDGVRVETLGSDGVILTGTVSSAAEAQQAYDIAARLLDVGTAVTTPQGSKIVNAITVAGRDQVMLKVTVAEVQRDVIKQLGVDISGNLAVNSATLQYGVINPFSAFGSALGQSAATASNGSISATLRAMERAGVVRTLAEPTLTAISGESAYFLAGGEFPIPGNFSCDPQTRVCQTSVQFKKFGVGLNFTPVVLSEGRISLKVMSEVSELSTENALTLTQSVGGGQNQTLTIPSVRTRRAETTLEIPSGGSMAMAGLIQEQTRQAINGVPGLMNLPILGALFKSRDYINRQTELMVLVTPYVVRAVAQKDLSRPDDGFADSSDPSAVLLGRLNRIYGTTGRSGPARTAATKPAGQYHGRYGFILD